MGEGNERGSALVYALALLTLIAVTILAVAAQVQSRATSVVFDERSVRLVALSDAALAETLAELAQDREFSGVVDRQIEGGSISSTVRAMQIHEVEISAVGRRDEWHAVIVARVNIKHTPRVLRWERTQGPD